ncbi:nuclease-like protein [Bacillus oleivorans]|uniref:Nuclease-like protein n=1 Tax=Bacillus oleivorans TaxID=1448271 RepID=A0A285D7N6_9BACI|nr:nuclease-related domain-containing protein [Bacillus oleivorans]SNX75288.1 nuclease-like protein [Bacillus oleivorans]
MIVKGRKFPLEIKALTVLRTRILQGHPQRKNIEDRIATKKAGYYGEKEVDYFTSLLPNEKFNIFQDLRLPNKNSFFQIDSLLITPNYALLLEVKNIQGQLYFDPVSNQFTRKFNGVESRFTEPILQSRRLKYQLHEWMKLHKMPDMPIEYLFVNSNPTAIFNFPDNKHPFYDRIIHADYLLEKISEFDRKYKQSVITPKQIQLIRSNLINEHTESKADVLKKFSIDKSDIITGVQCPNCRKIPMERINTAWLCSLCQHQSKVAHIPTLEEYVLLFGPYITNKSLREFLNLKSRYVTKRILISSTQESTGKNKGKVYKKYN